MKTALLLPSWMLTGVDAHTAAPFHPLARHLTEDIAKMEADGDKWSEAAKPAVEVR